MSMRTRFSLSLCSLAALTLFCGCKITGTSGIGGPTPASVTPIALPEEAATIWFPLSWTINIPAAKSETLGDSLASLRFNEVGLVLLNQASGAEHLIPFETTKEQIATSQRYVEVLDSRRKETMTLPRFFSLPPGTYAVEGIGGVLPEAGTAKGRRTTVPFKNLFGVSSQSKLEFSAKKGKVGVLPRVTIETKFYRKGQTLVHQSEFEAIDHDFVPGDLVLEQLGRGNRLASYLYPASTDFPKLRIPLPTSVDEAYEPTFGRVAMILESPCKLTGEYRLVWKRSGDTREYFNTVKMSDDNGRCANIRKTFFIMPFPYGKWSLLATQFSEKRENDSRKEKDNLLNVSFDFSDRRKLQGGELYDPNRHDALKDILYAGAIRLSDPVGGKEKSGSVDSIWERRFSITDLRSEGDSSRVYNAYRLMPITKDQTKETVRTVVRTRANATERIEKYRGELQRRAREVFAACVQERHQIDPLLIVSGAMAFSAMKWTNYVDFSNLEIEGDSASVVWFEECLEKRFRSFRFSERIPEPFQGTLSFQLE